MAYDCVKIIVVRDGSAFLFSEFGQLPVKSGDVILLGANVLAGSEPEGHITVTTIYIDTDYVLDQVRWQYAAFLEDRLDAQGFVERIYTEPAQILRLGEDRAGMLMPWLDEMVALSLKRISELLPSFRVGLVLATYSVRSYQRSFCFGHATRSFTDWFLN